MQRRARREDPVHGNFLDNTDLALAVRQLWSSPYDLDEDGRVDYRDLFELVPAWQAIPRR